MVKNTNSLRGDYISAINAIERVQNSNTERLNYVQGETIKNNTLLKDQNSIFRNLTNTMMGSLVASSNQIDNMEYYLKTQLNSVHGKLNNTVPLTGGYMTGSLELAGTLDVSAITRLNATTSSTSTTTGALVVDGGVGIAENTYIGGNLTVTGNFTVSGTPTTINSVTLEVNDKNIEMGVVDTPTNITADGGGITLKGDTDKTIIWDNANGNWTSNQNWNIATNKTFKINNQDVLSATTLGASVVNVGPLDQLTVDKLTLDDSTIQATTGYSLKIKSGSDHGIKFYIGDTTPEVEAMIIKSNGNVGIGTTSPSETLEVNGNIKADTAFIGEIYSNDYAGFSYSTMNTIGNYAILQNSVGDTFVNAASGKTIAFRIDNNNKMFMNSSGFVGIGGITNPPHALVVGPADTNGNPPNGSGAFSVRLGHAHIGNFGHNSGTHDQHNWVGFGWWNFGRAVGSTTGSNDYSVIQNGLGETRVNSSSGRNLKLCQNNSQKLIIDGSTGNVQLNFLRAIGTSSLTICRGDRNSSTTNGLFRFGNNGHHIDCYRQDTFGGRSLYINYYAAHKIIAPQYDIGSVSDRRIKENFEEIKDDEALQKLRLLNPLTYTYKATPDHERVYGFIAQEVKEVLPHAVNTDKLCIPNIVARASISIITMPSSQDENDIDGIVEEEVGGIITILDSSKNTDSLVVGCQALIRYLSCESQANVIVKNVIDSKTFEFEYGDGLAPLEKELLSGIDTHGNPYTNELILLGTEVDDFHILSKTAIWTVCCAALQEVDRQLQAEKAKTATLETKTATLQGIVASQQVIINELLSRVTALETV